MTKRRMTQMLSLMLALTLLLAPATSFVLAAPGQATLTITDNLTGTVNSGVGAVYTITKIATVSTTGETTPLDPEVLVTDTYTSGDGALLLDQYAVYRVEQNTRAPGYYLNTETMIIEYPHMVDGAIAADQGVILEPKLSPVLATVDVTKYADGTTTTPIQGTTFDLYQTADELGPITEVLVMTDLTTSATGEISIQNLTEGSYYLLETYVPAPYTFDPVAEYAFDVTVDAAGTALATINPIVVQNYTTPADLTFNKDVNELDAVTLPIGSQVSFTIEVQLPADIADYTTYIITDTLASTLTYVSASMSPASGFTVTNVGNEVTATITDFTQFTGVSSVTLTINATINTTATNGNDILNTATLEWDNSKGDVNAVDSDTVTITVAGGTIEVTKTNAATPALPLAGAQIALVDSTGAQLYDAANQPYRATTDVNGKATFSQLPAGTYFVKEVVAPSGYRINETATEILISDSTTKTVSIINYPTAAAYPTTGTFTRYLLYAGGIILIIAFLLYRRRKQKDNRS